MKLRNNNIMELFKQDPEQFEIISTPTGFSHRVKIDKEFEHSSQFAQLVEILETAGEQDVVQIRLGESPGGSVAAVLPLLSAMDNTDAFIHVHVDSDIASAATFLVMKAHMVTMNPHVSLMIHTASWGYGGHSGNMEASTNHYVKNIKALAHDIYDDFLTEVEFEKIFNGLEIWLSPEEVFERLKARQEKQKEECSCDKCDEEVEESPDILENFSEIMKKWDAQGTAEVDPKPVRKSRTKKEDK